MGEGGVPAKEPTELGRWLLDEMDRRGLSQTALAAGMGIGQATISRWIYTDIQPERDKIMRLADALTLAVAERAELSAITGLNLAADPDRPTATVPAMHPRAAEIARMLAPDSPISEDDRHVLELLLERIVDPYRKVMRRRKAG
jgi:transcriptional regulator with XRE-family HTH domain